MSILGRNRWISVGVCAALVVVAWSSASARSITIKWRHQAPPAAQGFRAHWGTSPGSYGSSTELLNPTLSSGEYSKAIEVGDATVYVVLVAYNAEGDSGFSNEQTYLAAGAPPPPPPPPPGSGAQAAVLGFALIDTQSGAMLDSSFQDGDAIPLSAPECIAIQIVGNDYLERASSPGSVRLEFDGVVPAACNEDHVTHDNGPPFLFRQNDCAPELQQVGLHELKATPFDGNDCTGAAGTAATVRFEVTDPVGAGGGIPDPEEPLGVPGKPELVN